MSVIVLLIAAGGLVAIGFLAGFIWAVGSGQFDDLATPPVRLLIDEPDEPDEPPVALTQSAWRNGGRSSAGRPEGRPLHRHQSSGRVHVD